MAGKLLAGLPRWWRRWEHVARGRSLSHLGGHHGFRLHPLPTSRGKVPNYLNPIARPFFNDNRGILDRWIEISWFFKIFKFLIWKGIGGKPKWRIFWWFFGVFTGFKEFGGGIRIGMNFGGVSWQQITCLCISDATQCKAIIHTDKDEFTQDTKRNKIRLDQSQLQLYYGLHLFCLFNNLYGECDSEGILGLHWSSYIFMRLGINDGWWIWWADGGDMTIIRYFLIVISSGWDN